MKMTVKSYESLVTQQLTNSLSCDDISLLDSNSKEFIRELITVYYTDSPYGEKFGDGIKKSDEPVEIKADEQEVSIEEPEEIVLQTGDETIELST